MSENRILGDQLSCCAWDGVYFHCGCDKLVREKLARTAGSLPCSHDWMHVCGLVDKKLCAKKEFKWVTKIVGVCGQLYRKVRY